MKTTLALTLLVLSPAVARAADAPAPMLPRPIVMDATALDAGTLASATWIAWRAGDPSSAQPVIAAEAGDSRWLTTTVLEPADARGSWLLLGRAPGFAATVLARAGELPPAATAIEAPEIAATASPSGIALSWSASPAAGLAGWRLERSADGAEWSLVALLPPDATGTSDAPPPGPWIWRLVPELVDGIDTGLVGAPSRLVRASDGDLDDDGVADDADRCRVFADASQADRDGDGISDACEVAFADVAPRGAPDGVVGLNDVIRLLRFAVGLETPDAAESLVADIAPALVLPGTSPERATPRLLAPRTIGIDDAVLALRVSVGLATLEPPR
jgi:hypothetical protein